MDEPALPGSRGFREIIGETCLQLRQRLGRLILVSGLLESVVRLLQSSWSHLRIFVQNGDTEIRFGGILVVASSKFDLPAAHARLCVEATFWVQIQCLFRRFCRIVERLPSQLSRLHGDTTPRPI